MPWKPIDTAPKDGTRILARSSQVIAGHKIKMMMETLWCKTSHVPLYGWNYGNDVENMEMWEPQEWFNASPIIATETT